MGSAQILELVDIFADLDVARLERIFAICQRATFRKGEVIFEENSPSKEFYVILEGKIEIHINQDPNSPPDQPPKRARIAVLFRGQSFGEIALVDQGLRSASAICGSETCTLLRIERHDFVRLLQEDHEMGYQVMTNLAADLCMKIRNTNFLMRETLLYGIKPS